jgi:hypothetical protein
VLFDDFPGILGRGHAVPDAFRVDDHGRAEFAHIETTRFVGPRYLAEAMLFELCLEHVAQGGAAFFAATAAGVGGIAGIFANENVKIEASHAQLRKTGSVTLAIAPWLPPAPSLSLTYSLRPSFPALHSPFLHANDARRYPILGGATSPLLALACLGVLRRLPLCWNGTGETNPGLGSFLKGYFMKKMMLMFAVAALFALPNCQPRDTGEEPMRGPAQEEQQPFEQQQQQQPGQQPGQDGLQDPQQPQDQQF